MRILDVRHEQTAAFAAEAIGKLTRKPGLAVLTAGPGVTNGVSADRAGAVQRLPAGRRRRPRAGEPVGQRLAAGARPAADPGAGLQAGPHHPHGAPRSRRGCTRRSPSPESSHRGPGRSSTSRWTSSSTPPPWCVPSSAPRLRPSPTPTRSPTSPSSSDRPSARSSCSAPTCGPTAPRRPRCASSRRPGLPTITNGMGRGLIPGGHPLLVTKARGAALGGADLVVVVGTPLDFRLGYGVFGGKDGAAPARVVHLADSPGQVSRHADLAGEAFGDLTLVLDGLREAVARRWYAGPTGRRGSAACRTPWPGGRARRRAARCDGRPDPPGPHLRRAGPPPGRGRRRDRRRRRLRLLRRQVRRAAAPRRLARPRPLRMSRRRARCGDRRPAHAALRPGRPALRRRCRGHVADGRRHPGPARPARW